MIRSVVGIHNGKVFNQVEIKVGSPTGELYKRTEQAFTRLNFAMDLPWLSHDSAITFYCNNPLLVFLASIVTLPCSVPCPAMNLKWPVMVKNGTPETGSPGLIF